MGESEGLSTEPLVFDSFLYFRRAAEESDKEL